MGGKTRVQGKDRDQARSMLADALAVQEAGAFAIVLELMPEQLAAAITARLRIPTIGIGAGRALLGAGPGHHRPPGPRLVHPPPRPPVCATCARPSARRPRAYAADVLSGDFPGAEQSTRMDETVLADTLGTGDLDRPAGDDLVSIPLDRDL